MTNIYGAELDRNGYAKSILNDTESRCFVCERGGDLVRHEVFYGTAYRSRSKELGLWVNVCPECHRKIHDHDSEDTDRQLKEIAQMKAMDYYGWNIQEFRQRFGKNWL